MKFKNISSTIVDGAKPGRSIELDPESDADRARRLVKRGVISWDEYLAAFVDRDPKKPAPKKKTSTKGDTP